MNQNQKSIFIKKLLYQSKNRGCKETGLILGKFANRFLLDADEESLRDFATILEQDDTDIYDWITKKIPPSPHLDSKVMQNLLKFNINKNND